MAERSFKERIPCEHRFSVPHLLSNCTSQQREENIFTHFTGFNSYQEFKSSLEFVWPDLHRSRLIYWDSKAGRSSTIDTEQLFDKIKEDEADSDTPDQEDIQNKTRDGAHKFPVEDKYLMLCMKLRMGLTNIDLSDRFCTSDGTVNNILLTRINYLFITLSS